jgi:hypothetical protein
MEKESFRFFVSKRTKWDPWFSPTPETLMLLKDEEG